MPGKTRYQLRQGPPGYTLIEILLVIAIVGLLAALLVTVLGSIRRSAKRLACTSNLRQLTTADLAYLAEKGRFPRFTATVPSSIPVPRLQAMANFLRETVPPGPASTWPRRAEQPAWFLCPLARESTFAEGLTAGGGLYTGYVYLGGVEQSKMVSIGLATLAKPNRAANALNQQRGVVWADVVAEYKTGAEDRFEFFHASGGGSSSGFVLPRSALEGANRAWSDGSVEWTSFDLVPAERQLSHVLGYYYY